ncbi:MAG TPA: hypothetical protein VMF86_10470 [Stellaceae bacterium]|nr:hypothetical protein [Stellaceae bacterium]
MSVMLRNPRTGDTKIVPEGWCWSCCIGSGILGLPLYRRGLSMWGSVMVVFNICATVIVLVPTARAATLDTWLTVIGIGLSLFFGLRANRMALDHYLDLGWEYADAARRRFG